MPCDKRCVYIFRSTCLHKPQYYPLSSILLLTHIRSSLNFFEFDFLAVFLLFSSFFAKFFYLCDRLFYYIFPISSSLKRSCSIFFGCVLHHFIDVKSHVVKQIIQIKNDKNITQRQLIPHPCHTDNRKCKQQHAIFFFKPFFVLMMKHVNM